MDMETLVVFLQAAWPWMVMGLLLAVFFEINASRKWDKISVYPKEQRLKDFCLSSDIDIILIFSKQTLDSKAYAHTRVFAPRFGYLEDPATGSGNSAFANYLLSGMLWDGQPITIEQGGNNRIFNSIKLKCWDGYILFGGKATKKIEGLYFKE